MLAPQPNGSLRTISEASGAVPERAKAFRGRSGGATGPYFSGGLRELRECAADPVGRIGGSSVTGFGRVRVKSEI